MEGSVVNNVDYGTVGPNTHERGRWEGEGNTDSEEDWEGSMPILSTRMKTMMAVVVAGRTLPRMMAMKTRRVGKTLKMMKTTRIMGSQVGTNQDRGTFVNLPLDGTASKYP